MVVTNYANVSLEVLRTTTTHVNQNRTEVRISGFMNSNQKLQRNWSVWYRSAGGIEGSHESRLSEQERIPVTLDTGFTYGGI
jgi:hypothetical protein